jgi:hypothetical protein
MGKRRIDESPRKPNENSTGTLLLEQDLDDGVEKLAKKDDVMPNLLIESNPTYLTLVESKGDKIIVRGEFGRVGVPTLNGRIYPEEVMQKEINRLSEDLANRRIWGTIDHPENGKTSIKDVSHVITGLKIKDGIVIGEAEVLNTPAGKIVKALVEAHVQVPVSSRGLGSTRPSDDPKVEGEVVQKDFVLKTWDFVAEPAVRTAIPQAFTEDVEDIISDISQMFLDEFPEITKTLQEDAIENAKLKVNKGVEEAVKEAEERVRAEMAESFEKKFAESILEAKDEISNELREEFSSDPDLGGAKAMLTAIYEMVAPFRGTEDELALADASKAKDLEVAEAKAKASESEKRAVQAECKGYIEREIGSHPMAESIRALVAKHQFESLDDAKNKLEAILKDLPDRADEGFVSEEEAKIREENAEMRAQISLLTERVESLNVKLKRAVDVGMKADTQREDAEGRVVEAKKELEESVGKLREKLEEAQVDAEESRKKLKLEVYKHEQVAGLANGRKLLSLMEGVTSEDVVDRLVTEQGVENVSDRELNEMRKKLQRGKGERQEPEQLNETRTVSKPKRGKDDLGNDMGYMKRLAGVNND